MGGMPSSEMPGVFIRRSSGLTRQVSAWDALMYASITPGILWPFIYIMWGPWLYPGAHMVWATLAVFMFYPIAALYWLFSTAMPRSGAEYVYISRTIHPLVAMMVSFCTTFLPITAIAPALYWGLRFGFVDMFRGIGFALGMNQTWLSFADALDNNFIIAGLGTALIGLLLYIYLRGTKWMMRLSWMAIIAAVFGTIIFAIAVLLFTDNFASNWTTLTGFDYNKVIPAAADNGYTTSFTITGTLFAGMTYVGLNTLFQTFSANIAGEVRGVQRSQLIALLGSLSIQLVLWLILYALCYTAWGAEWMNSLTNLAFTNNPAYPLAPHEPHATLLLGIMSRSPIFVILLAVPFFVTAYGCTCGQGFAPTRNLFAWAFDRMIPPWFANIDSRFHAPYAVAITSAFVGWVFFLIQVFLPDWMAGLTYQILAWFAAWIVFGIAGIYFPWSKGGRLFNAAPPVVKTRFLGFPVISWLGILTVIISAATVYVMAIPIFQGAVTVTGMIIAALFLVLGIPLYYGSTWYWKSKGVNLKLQFDEVPPD
jgi:amino acid transporter